MALIVASGMLAKRGFDTSEIAKGYLHWWHNGAFDTGPTTDHVLALVDRGCSFQEAAEKVDMDSKGYTAGCNPAHRAAPIACHATIPESDLVSCANAEAALTHRNPLAGDAAAAVVILCRALILGTPWSAALHKAAVDRTPPVWKALQPSRSAATLKRSGFAPDALAAAIHFVHISDSFDKALKRAIQFAGPANYCPVLVGSIGGARWGATQVPRGKTGHHGAIMNDVRAKASALARTWVEPELPPCCTSQPGSAQVPAAVLSTPSNGIPAQPS